MVVIMRWKTSLSEMLFYCVLKCGTVIFSSVVGISCLFWNFWCMTPAINGHISRFESGITHYWGFLCGFVFCIVIISSCWWTPWTMAMTPVLLSPAFHFIAKLKLNLEDRNQRIIWIRNNWEGNAQTCILNVCWIIGLVSDYVNTFSRCPPVCPCNPWIVLSNRPRPRRIQFLYCTSKTVVIKRWDL
jgi:hypothetical protein